MDRIEFGKRLIRESSAAQRMNAAMDKRIESAGEKALRDTQKPDKPKKPDAKTVAFKQRVAKKLASMSPEQRSQVKNKEKAQTSSAIVKRDSSSIVKRDPDKGTVKRDTTKVDKIKKKLKIRMDNKKKLVKSGLRPISKSIARSKLKSPSLTQISSDEKGATAMKKGAGNVVKTAATTASNVAKVGAKAARHGVRALDYLRKNVKVTREEFIHEVEEKDKKDKLDKVIDIMKGKNKIKINPDMKEQVKTDNWKDNYVATEYETVDLIKPEPLNPSNWRKELDSLRP